MDKLAKRLREDAAAIDAPVSPELDYRIRASLEGVVQERPVEPTRSLVFWWASSLTGLAAALLVVVLFNVGGGSEEPVPVVNSTPPPDRSLPRLPLRTEAAMITSPLQKELDDLAADLRKARDEVASDVESVLPPEKDDEGQ